MASNISSAVTYCKRWSSADLVCIAGGRDRPGYRHKLRTVIISLEKIKVNVRLLSTKPSSRSKKRGSSESSVAGGRHQGARDRWQQHYSTQRGAISAPSRL